MYRLRTQRKDGRETRFAGSAVATAVHTVVLATRRLRRFKRRPRYSVADAKTTRKHGRLEET